MQYDLVRSRKRKKTITLQVNRQGRVVIHAPYHTTITEIEKVFQQKASWIEEKLADHRVRAQEAPSSKAFVSGETFFYLGEAYPLTVSDRDGSGPPLALTYGQFVLCKDKVTEARELFVRWYKRRAREILTERVPHWSRQLGLVPSGVRITSAACRYGSCSAKDHLSFTWRIIMAPYTVIDYVIIHELAHIREKNHSRRFWESVERIVPDYRKRRHWLKEHQHLFAL